MTANPMMMAITVSTVLMNFPIFLRRSIAFRLFSLNRVEPSFL